MITPAITPPDENFAWGYTTIDMTCFAGEFSSDGKEE